ncbi:TlpA family protein disulfide reductase [Flavobacterium pallidum]|nr:redoxin domain-containing protein [Flavobacterium pallidum]
MTLIIFSGFAFGQQREEKTFSVAVKQNIKKYNTLSSKAYESGDIEQGQFLFDTLVSNQLAGTKFEDYTLKKFSGGKLKLSAIKKPLMIQTYASWCVINKGEIPALNKLARKYYKDLQIVVVFWDKKQAAKSLASQFNGYIEVCYANENYKKDEAMVATLKYAIGFLTSYYLDENLKVISIKKGTMAHTPKKTPLKEAIKQNFDIYNEALSSLLVKSDIKKEILATH